MIADSIYRRADAVITRRIAGETVVVPIAGTAAAPRDTRFFVLNGSAERLWDFLSSPQSASAMARHLTDEYGIAMSAAENDVLAFLKDLELNGLIVPETNQ